VPGVADEVVDVDAAVIAGKAGMALTPSTVRATLSAAGPAATIFGAAWNGAVTSGPVPVADAAVIFAAAVS